MAKWIITDPKCGDALVRQPEDETLEYDNGQQAAAAAAAFLIDFRDVEVSTATEEDLAAVRDALNSIPIADEEEEPGEAAGEPGTALRELHVVCLEHGVRIRMIREPLEPLA